MKYWVSPLRRGNDAEGVKCLIVTVAESREKRHEGVRVAIPVSEVRESKDPVRLINERVVSVALKRGWVVNARSV